MFTSLFQLEKKPVTVFSSDDVGAPTLTKDAGSLKTLLKACLVTGYGSKAALGWQMLFESVDKNSAAFASQDPTASKYVLKINDGGAKAIFSAYSEMTSIDAGLKALVENRETDLRSNRWLLIGHSKSFVFASNSASAPFSFCMFFGDLPRQVSRTAPVVGFWSNRYFYQAGGLQSVLFENVNGVTATSSSTSLSQATSHPFLVSADGSSVNLKKSACKFNHASFVAAPLLYDLIISELPDATWTILPLQPMSNVLSDVASLGKINANAVKIATGDDARRGYNGDCAVATDFWWA